MSAGDDVAKLGRRGQLLVVTLGTKALQRLRGGHDGRDEMQDHDTPPRLNEGADTRSYAPLCRIKVSEMDLAKTGAGQVNDIDRTGAQGFMGQRIPERALGIDGYQDHDRRYGY